MSGVRWTKDQLAEYERKHNKARSPMAFSGISGAGQGKVASGPEKPQASVFRDGLEIHLSGQIRGGKNNMGVTKTGRHYPKKTFATWRDNAIMQASRQANRCFFATPVSAIVVHRAGDRRRRDIPAILDALFHVLERAGIVADDSLIKQLSYGELYAPKNAGADIILRALTKNS